MQKRCPRCFNSADEAEICVNCGYVFGEEKYIGALSGKILKDRYEAGAIFEQDGVSTVYFGFDGSLNERVLIREFDGNAVSGCQNRNGNPITKENAVERMLQYGKILASAGMCEVIPKTVDVFESNGNAYIVSEFFEGKRLSEIIQSGINISQQNALKITKELMQGLKILHNSRMVFGIVTPQNLFLQKDGKVKLFSIGAPYFDFIANNDKKCEWLNASYTAPEFFEEDAGKGAYSDVYSVAAILYFMLTGITPPLSYERKNADRIISLNKANENIPKFASNAIMNALNPGVNYRTKTLNAFSEELASKNAKRKMSFGMLFALCAGKISLVIEKSKIKKQKDNHKTDEETKKPLSQKAKLAIIFSVCAVIVVAALSVAAVLIIKSVSKNSGKDGNSGTSNTSKGSDLHYSYYDNASSKKKKTSSKKTSSYDFELGENQTVSPNVVGMSLEDATSAIEQAELVVGKITEKVVPGYETGTVIEQGVPGGIRVEKGKSVSLTVALSDKEGEMPNVVGLEMSEAISKLKNAGFSNVEVEFKRYGVNAGEVTEQSIAPKERTDFSKLITLTVTGEKVTVGKYTGLILSNAISKNKYFNFEYIDENGVGISVPQGEENNYRVIAQSLAEGTDGYKGQTLVLNVKIIEEQTSSEAPTSSGENSGESDVTDVSSDS